MWKRIGKVLAVGVASITCVVGVSLFPGDQANAATPCVDKMYKQGSSSSCVRYIQQIINASGTTSKIDADGAFGSNTKKAVIAFQKSKNLTADGTVGVNTWNALCKVSGSAADGPQKNAGCKTSGTKTGWTPIGDFFNDATNVAICRTSSSGTTNVKAKISSNNPLTAKIYKQNKQAPGDATKATTLATVSVPKTGETVTMTSTSKVSQSDVIYVGASNGYKSSGSATFKVSDIMVCN